MSILNIIHDINPTLKTNYLQKKRTNKYREKKIEANI